MAFGRTTIYWETTLFDNDIGSIRVSSSNDGELGSYANIATIDSGSPTYIGSYIGSATADKITTWYRIEVIDSGIGSSWSGSSDPIRPVEGRLASVNHIKRIARLSAGTDISDFEIIDYIDDAENEVFENYGDPIRRTFVYLDSSIGSTVYDFTGNRVPVYSIREVRADGLEIPLNVGSWELGGNQGYIKLDSTFILDYNSKRLSIDWIPKVLHTLVAYKAALNLIDSSQIIDGEEVRNPLAMKLERRIGSLADSIRPKEVFRSTNWINWDERDSKYIYQWEFYDI